MDFIGSYPRPFSSLPKPHALNLSIQLGGMRKGFGGCAMNIAVTLCHLGRHAVPFAYVGGELDADYARHLRGIGIDQRGLMASGLTELAAHALILTDPHENQFTAFYPGKPKPRFREDLQGLIMELNTDIDFAVIAPDVPEYMIKAATICRDHGIPFMCDPGQCTTAFTGHDCNTLVALSSMVCFNRFEYEIFESHVPDIADRLDLTLVTQGADGVEFKVHNEWQRERAAVPRQRVDPTGCGDAFRAGLVHAHLADASWRDAVRAGCTLATINLEHVGTQLHNPCNFKSRYVADWDDEPTWLGCTA